MRLDEMIVEKWDRMKTKESTVHVVLYTLSKIRPTWCVSFAKHVDVYLHS